jgi:ribosomal protein L12E/L44/L45/RPP1/RPP2
MKNLHGNVIASLLALAVTAGVAPAAASSFNDAQPQCGGDDKKESKGGDKKDDKSSDTKPKPPVQG